MMLISISYVNAESTYSDNNEHILNLEENQNISQPLRSEIGSFSELNELINNNQSVITLEKDYAFNSSSDLQYKTGIKINHTVEINGNNHTIDGQTLARIFVIESNNVVLNNITFINGATSDIDKGGAIHCTRAINFSLLNCDLINNTGMRGGALTLIASPNNKIENCNFINNTAKYDAGAIYSTGTDNLINNSRFYNNGFTTPSNSFCGGAILLRGKNSKILSSKFYNNSAYEGGGIYDDDYDSLIYDCYFENNSAIFHGGALYTYAELTIDNCIIDNNSAGEAGGGIVICRDNTHLKNSILRNNNATNAGALYLSYLSNNSTLTNNTFISNWAVNTGGTITIASNNISLIDNVISESYAKTRGGSILWYGENGIISNITIQNSYCLNYGGGAIYVHDNAKNFNILNSNFTNCSSNNYGGAIEWVGDKGKLTNTVLDNTFAINYGGSILWSGHNGTIENVNFTNSNTENHGGAIVNLGENITIDGCIFNNCSSEYDAGSIYWMGLNGILNNSLFNNSNTINGGSIYWTGDSGTILNSNFTNSQAAMNGGAIYWLGSQGTIDNCNFNDCISKERGYGGAIYWNSPKNSDSNQIINSNFNNNSAYIGGGIYLSDSDNVLIKNSTLENNVAYDGGAIYSIASNVVISDSNLKDNFAWYGGGGITFEGINNTISNSTFINNNANNYGGGVSSVDAYIINSTFTNNTAVFGGAIYTINSKIDNVILADNVAQELGNHIFAIDDVTIINTEISDDDKFINHLNKTVFYLIDGYGATIGEYDCVISEYYNLESNCGIFDNSTKLLRNRINSKYIGDYLKILVYKYFDKNQNLRDNQELVAAIIVFTDFDFESSNNTLVKSVLSDYNSGLRIKDQDISLSNGNLIKYEFVTFINPVAHYNLFGYNLNISNSYNESIQVNTINKTAFVNDIVGFEVVLTNTGNQTLNNVFFEYNQSQGLIFDSIIGDNWTYDPTNNRLNYNNQLNINENASVILLFKSNDTGIQTLTANGGFEEFIINSANNTTHIYKPSINASIIVNPSTVNVDENIEYTITILNNGDCNLTEVFVNINDNDSLIYKSFIGSDWNIIGDKFIYNGILEPNKSTNITLIFKSPQPGIFNPLFIFGSNETNNNSLTKPIEVIAKENNQNQNNTNNKTEKKDPQNKNNTNKITKKINPKKNDFKAKIEEKTGNPILLLLLAIVSIYPIRRYKK